LTSSSLLRSSLCYQFADDVVHGRIVSGVKRVQACERFLRELELSEDPAYPWRFDLARAYRPIDFIERFCRPTKGDYDKMELLPWQHFVEGNLYGWVDKNTGLRRFREGLVLVGSGNGKSTLITGNAIFGACKDGERGAECYCVANAKDQARIIFDECKAEINASPALKKHFRVLRDGIYYDATASKVQALASDPTTLDGKNVHLAIFDEVQDYRDYSFISRLKKKIIKRRQPLIIYISTLGNVIDGPLMDLYVLGGKVLARDPAVSAIAADRMFVYIDEIDEHDDPDDVTCWGKANPSLGVLLNLDAMIADWERCKMVPAERADWINKQLNVFTSVDALSFLDVKTILKNNAVKPLEELRGAVCYGGFDLSTTEDFTAACLEFPLADDWFFVLEHSWVPETKVKVNHEKLDWRMLQDEGHLTVVPGEYVRFEYVYEWFRRMRELYRIETIGYDPAKAFELVQKLQGDGFVLNAVRQGELTLSGPQDHLKERFLDGKIIHNNDPLFVWYLGNAKMTKRSVNETYLITKQGKYRKIDGVAALLDSHTEYLRRRPMQIAPDQTLTTVISLR
jgi:phage terminase large subunit-like protein